CRTLPDVCAPTHLLQLLRQPAPSKVPGRRCQGMAGRSPGRTLARAVFPRRSAFAQIAPPNKRLAERTAAQQVFDPTPIRLLTANYRSSLHPPEIRVTATVPHRRFPVSIVLAVANRGL